ncbi:hypothetical protein FMEAI12_3940086 [Parafrankia sp. Ea1.12]|nr:hypothetical protein FMEAI12_3940086 [Parafrankia sp. Ea1.12]
MAWVTSSSPDRLPPPTGRLTWSEAALGWMGARDGRIPGQATRGLPVTGRRRRHTQGGDQSGDERS